MQSFGRLITSTFFILNLVANDPLICLIVWNASRAALTAFKQIGLAVVEEPQIISCFFFDFAQL